MTKRILTALCFVMSGAVASAQTLFTYGNETVTVQEFLKAYQKNNTAAKSPADLQNYLDLYIASRLKIKEAKACGYDTIPQLVTDLENLRTQILPGYMTDEEAINGLLKEAFGRSQKDIHTAHIFIAFDRTDSTVARQKAEQAYQQLKSGKPFAQVAKAFSADPSVKENGGDIGYITVFTLPYEMESRVYATPAGQVAPIYKSKVGYHIFKNVGERKAAGRIRVAQILLAFPPESDAVTKAALKKQADSLYALLQKGADFGKLATQFSGDPVSAVSNGQIPAFGVGQYDPLFENTAFSLPKDGAISKPFLTAHGWHIVKRLERELVSTEYNGSKVQDELKEKVKGSDRIQTANARLIQKVAQQYKPAAFATTALWAYSDSVLNNKAGNVPSGLSPQSPLFFLSDEATTVANWIQYAQTNRFNADGSGIKPYSQLWDEFVTAAELEYYKKHLEQYNPAFKAQLEEFKEGNLFFEIMQREIWNPAQNDTTALLNYYKKHQANYMWKESADAVVFYASDIPVAQLFFKDLSKTPADWRTVVARYNDQVVADSNRFELEQLPGATKGVKAGAITSLVANKEDNTASFAYIMKLYNKPEQRSYAAARGLVINDYQATLEKAWLEQLRKKYPVQIDQKVLDTLTKQ